jgi:hypothetical protein
MGMISQIDFTEEVDADRLMQDWQLEYRVFDLAWLYKKRSDINMGCCSSC